MSKRTQLLNDFYQFIQNNVPQNQEECHVHHQMAMDDVTLDISIDYAVHEDNTASISIDVLRDDELLDASDFDIIIRGTYWQDIVADRLNYLIDCYSDWEIERPTIKQTKIVKTSAPEPVAKPIHAINASELGVSAEIENRQIYDTDKDLIELFIDAGYDFILPFTPADTMRKRLYEEYDADNYYDEDAEYYFDGEEDDAVNGEGYRQYTQSHEQSRDDLIIGMREASAFPEDSDEAFLRRTPWELLGITPHQFHQIDPERLSSNLDAFYDFIQNMSNPDVNSTLPDAGQRINFALLYSNTNHSFKVLTPELIRYIAKIAGKYDYITALGRLQHYNDYRDNRYNAMQYNERVRRQAEIANQTIDDFLAEHTTEYPYAVYDYPEFPKLSRLDDLHDKAMRAARAEEDLSQSAFTVETDKNIRARVATPEYKSFLYKEGQYAIVGVKDLADLKREGIELNHCVGSYGTQLAEGSSLIYFARNAKALNQSFYTAEIVDRGGQYRLNQLYGYGDTTNKSEEFRAFIHKWCHTKHIKIQCIV